MNQNQLGKPIATAKQLYGLLDGVARSLQNCQPEGDPVVESSVRARVASEIILLLGEAGYPVSVTKMTHMGRYSQFSITYEVKLATLFNEGDYESAIRAIQSILTEEVK